MLTDALPCHLLSDNIFFMGRWNLFSTLGFNSCTDVDKAAGTGGQSYTGSLCSSARCQTCLKHGKTLLYAAGPEALWPQRSLHWGGSVCRIKCGLDSWTAGP